MAADGEALPDHCGGVEAEPVKLKGEMMSELACETPLIDLLLGVPADARMIYEESPTSSHSIPVGRLCADAAAAIERLRTDYANACKLVADMHLAAMGQIVGPVLGVVEDVAALRNQRDIAIDMLAQWCNAVDTNGTGWDDWDEHYKDAAYRPTPIRELIDAARAALKEQTP